MCMGLFFSIIVNRQSVNNAEKPTLPANTALEPSATAPGAPTIIGVLTGASYVTLIWSAPSNDGGSPLTGYKLYTGTTSGGETFLTNVGDIWYNDTSLTIGQVYYFQVSAVNGIGEGPRSDEINATPGLPTAPIWLTATARNGQIILNWSAPSRDGGYAITHYKIYQGTTSGGETLLATIGVTLTYTATGLTNGQTYYYKIAAVNSQGTGANSTEASAMSGTVPSAPTGLTVETYNAAVTLYWVAPASNGGSNITHYKIYIGTTPGHETLNTTTVTMLDYTVDNLHDGQVYYFKVAAVNAFGTGANSTEISATPGSTTPHAQLSGYPFACTIVSIVIVCAFIDRKLRKNKLA